MPDVSLPVRGYLDFLLRTVVIMFWGLGSQPPRSIDVERCTAENELQFRLVLVRTRGICDQPFACSFHGSCEISTATESR